MKKQNRTTQRGFTLIELMLVVLIIGVLSGIMLGVINIPGIQAKSRDARRIGDIKKIQTSLELYFSDFRGYPTKVVWQDVSSGASPLSSVISPNYITRVPDDPKDGSNAPAGVACFNGNTAYAYYYITNAGAGGLSGKYVLGAIMEVAGSATDNLCSNLGNCTGGAITCVCGVANCYGVENPL